MKHKPVVKLSRSLDLALTDKAARHIDANPYRPGQHGRRRHVPSEYGLRLREEQRLRAQYFLSETQMARAFEHAHRQSGPTGENLLADLETRLDATVLRAGFATTIYQARQLVSHGHLLVGERRVDRPAYRLEVGETVTVRLRSRTMPVFAAAKDAPRPCPAYLERNLETLQVAHLRRAERSEISTICDLQLVIEYYAR